MKEGIMNSLLCCYFPTKIVFVDDNSRMLKSLGAILDMNVASYDFFDDPYTALESINNSQTINFLSPSFSIREREVEEIYKTIYNPKRHEEVSTVIVDYEMPGMKGLEFCEKLKNPHIRKILYTGVADEELAIQAFNKGIIDGFIRKNTTGQAAVINEFIRESQFKYFKSLTGSSIETIIKEYAVGNPEDTALYDPVFASYFNELLEKNNICEYYLNDISGGFVFLTSKGKPSALFIYSEENFENIQLEFQGILENKIAEGKRISSSLIKDLEENRKTVCLPFCGVKMNPDPETWDKYAYPVQSLKGNQTYYVAYVPDADYVNHSEIISFEKYSRSR